MFVKTVLKYYDHQMPPSTMAKGLRLKTAITDFRTSGHATYKNIWRLDRDLLDHNIFIYGAVTRQSYDSMMKERLNIQKTSSRAQVNLVYADFEEAFERFKASDQYDKIVFTLAVTKEADIFSVDGKKR